MKFANATKLDRKSGVAKWRDPRFLFPNVPMHHDGCYVQSPALPARTICFGPRFAPELGKDWMVPCYGRRTYEAEIIDYYKTKYLKNRNALGRRMT